LENLDIHQLSQEFFNTLHANRIPEIAAFLKDPIGAPIPFTDVEPLSTTEQAELIFFFDNALRYIANHPGWAIKTFQPPQNRMPRPPTLRTPSTSGVQILHPSKKESLEDLIAEAQRSMQAEDHPKAAEYCEKGLQIDSHCKELLGILKALYKTCGSKKVCAVCRSYTFGQCAWKKSPTAFFNQKAENCFYFLRKADLE
jgi:hypothetical protein